MFSCILSNRGELTPPGVVNVGNVVADVTVIFLYVTLLLKMGCESVELLCQ
jgi:hypothetical protein